ncbi:MULTISPECIES: SphA family protein [Marinobacter]|uniref:SphA family protein n=1 Tax=Marinobacter TaxID=2742 RepID=UPI0009FA101F|nr:transporter [Marinobacter sp. C18]
MKLKKQILTRKILAMAICTGTAVTVQAVENGVTNWPNGVNTVLPAMMPAPGETQFYGYTVFYSADEFKDTNGDTLPGKFELDVFAQAFRLNHTWDYQTDSGITFTSGAILSGGRNSLDVGVADDSETGLNQIYLTPLYVNWSASESLHFSTGFSGFIPLGDYDRNNLINTTSNTASYVQEFNMTWFANQEWELSLSPTFTFNFENDDTDYESGDVFNVDYFAGYRPASAPQWQVGVAGHYTKQFSDDEINGQTVGDGNRLQKLAIGPQVFYGLGPKTAIVFKYLHETEVENSSEGGSFWFQFAMPL